MYAEYRLRLHQAKSGSCMHTKQSPTNSIPAEPYWELRRALPISGIQNQYIPPKFPFLVARETGQICEPALIFLYESLVTNNPNLALYNRKNNTLEATAFDLKDWWNYLEFIERAWNEATVTDLMKYCRVMQGEFSPTTGKANAVTTVNRRKYSIQKMYQWAKRHLKESLPPDQKHRYLITFDWTNEKLPRVKASASSAKPPTIFQKWQVRTVLEHLGETVYALAAKISLMVGLRISEITSLKASEFSLGEGYRVDPLTMTRIRVFGKGGKVRQVHFPGMLFNEISSYVYAKRAQLIRETAQKNLSKLLLHKYRGSAQSVTVRSIQRHFNQACIKSGITRESTIYKGTLEDNEHKPAPRNVTEAAAVFHDLRHTFAVWTYYARKQAGDAEPWMYIQKQLGHLHLTTTQDTYLASTIDFEARVSDSYIEALNEKLQKLTLPVS
ncbi:tyrosine-type recombinase/integrase [Acidovorax sp.]|uniref:tyrosine-type recombinase/integrase n=1 Tax=Acidovorax sp. TaxID=1872122 RepID=UPI004037E97F